MRLSYDLEQALEWDARAWFKKIPFIEPKPDWTFQPIFPFCGAMARFRIGLKGKDARRISVYLDTTSTLGICCDDNNKPLPYWEIYPDVEEETSRFPMDKVEELTAAIDAAVRKWNP